MNYCVLNLAAILSLAASESNKKPDLTGIKCVVSGRPALVDYVADYNGGRIYFDCEISRKKFVSNQVKYSLKANHQLVVTEQFIQQRCPISLQPISNRTSMSASVAGVNLRVCCEQCRKRLNDRVADPIDQIFGSERFQKIFLHSKRLSPGEPANFD